MLYSHQEKILESLTNGKAYVVAQPRCGKTRPVIACLGSGDVLVLTKKAAIKGWHSELCALGVEGWTVTNYEQVRTSKWDKSRHWDHLVLDECHSLAKYPKPALTCKAVFGLKVTGRRIGVSATPCAETHSQLFHQAKALKLPLWEKFTNFYKWFRAYGIPEKIMVHGRQVETYKKVKPVVWDEFASHCVVLDRRTAVASFVEANDVVVTLCNDNILTLCKTMKKDQVLEIEGKTVVAETALAVAQKCHQLCGGTVICEGDETAIVSTYKVDWLREAFRGVKIAVLTMFRAEVSLVKKSLENEASLGLTDDPEAFQSSGAECWFVGSIPRFARGVDLSAAEAIVIYSMPWSAESFIQARERFLRNDREKPAPVYFPVLSGGIDEQIYKRVAIGKVDFHAKCYSM